MKTEIKALIDAMSKRFTSHPWHGIELGEKSPAIVNAFIEIIPSDSIKYEIDKASGYIMVLFLKLIVILKLQLSLTKKREEQISLVMVIH
jgi:hypothetical protein